MLSSTRVGQHLLYIFINLNNQRKLVNSILIALMILFHIQIYKRNHDKPEGKKVNILEVAHIAGLVNTILFNLVWSFNQVCFHIVPPKVLRFYSGSCGPKTKLNLIIGPSIWISIYLSILALVDECCPYFLGE